jgi:hypothetical protein
MNLVREQHAFMLDLVKLINLAAGSGFLITGGELWRTAEQQAIYVRTGRSKTMNSQHGRRLAVDLNFFRDGELTYDVKILQPLGDFWEGLHSYNKWGGNWKSFKDVPHFERRVP